MEAHTIERAVRGHHIFKSVWQPVIGEILHTKREESNPVDRHAVAVIKTSQQTVGHMPPGNFTNCLVFPRAWW